MRSIGRMLLCSTCGALWMAAAGCGEAGGSVESDLAAIDSVRAEYTRSVNARDAPEVLARMTEGVVHLAPQAPPYVGREAVGEMLGPAYEDFVPAVTMTPVEVTVEGDAAVEWGCLGGTITSVDGSREISNEGKYLRVYRRVAGAGWKVDRDAFNYGPCDPSAVR